MARARELTYIVFKVNNMTAEKRASVSTVHNYTVDVVNASYEGQEDCGIALSRASLACFRGKGPSGVSGRSCCGDGWFAYGPSGGSCGRGRHGNGGGAFDGH